MTDINVPYGHLADRPQSWGRENHQIAFGYTISPKNRWSRQVTHYQDIAALERFGIDPTRPAGAGIITQANSYGYAIDGYTTGYTVKLPPPADPQAAQRTPRSGLQPTVVATSENADPEASQPPPSDEPSLQDPRWQYPDRQSQALNQGRRELLQKDAIFAHTYGEDALARRQGRWRPGGGIGDAFDAGRPPW